MGYELRFINSKWKHPVDDSGFIPLLNGENFNQDLANWYKYARLFNQGICFIGPDKTVIKVEKQDMTLSVEEYCGPRPDLSDYSPVFTREETDCIVVYENCTDGMPVSVPEFGTNPCFPYVTEKQLAIQMDINQNYNKLVRGRLDYTFWVEWIGQQTRGRKCVFMA